MTSSTKDQKQQELNTYKIETYEPNTFIQRLSFMLIRPPKSLYNSKILNKIPKGTHTHRVQKIPFNLSIYYPIIETKYIILYLHGNSSNRIQGSAMLSKIPQNVGLACFDFQACGNRDGEYITLGIKQSEQVDIAARYLKNKGFQVIGWGRSMGAVSLLMSSQCSVMVVDSAFSNLRTLCLEFALKQASSIPNILIYCLYPCVYNLLKKDIFEKTGCNIDELNICQRIQEMSQKKSIFFMSGQKDQIINHEHTKKLFNKFNGIKQLLIFNGNHNSIRQKYVYDKCFNFISKSINMIPERTSQYMTLRSENEKNVSKFQDWTISNQQEYK